MKQSHQGFSLIELMVTVAIVAILASVAYPSYRNQILRSHRTEAKTELLKIQVAQEKYFLDKNTYGSLVQIGMTASGTSYTTPNGYYKISFSDAPSTTKYTVQAEAQGSQTDDTGCGTFSIDQTGKKTPTTGNCWTR